MQIPENHTILDTIIRPFILEDIVSMQHIQKLHPLYLNNICLTRTVANSNTSNIRPLSLINVTKLKLTVMNIVSRIERVRMIQHFVMGFVKIAGGHFKPNQRKIKTRKMGGDSNGGLNSCYRFVFMTFADIPIL